MDIETKIQAYYVVEMAELVLFLYNWLGKEKGYSQTKIDNKRERKNMEKEEVLYAQTNEETTIDLVELCSVLLKRWWVILIGGLIGIFVAGVYTYQIATPIYQASAAIYMRGSGNTVASLQDLQIGAELTNDYEQIFKSRPILEKVVENLGLDMTYKQLRTRIQLTNPSDTRILRITVNDPDPQKAADIVNALVEVSMDSVREIDAKEPYLIESAVVDWDAISPSPQKNLMMGALFGIVAVIGVLVLRFAINDRVRTMEELEKVMQCPVLASLPESSVYNFERRRKRKRVRR